MTVVSSVRWRQQQPLLQLHPQLKHAFAAAVYLALLAAVLLGGSSPLLSFVAAQSCIPGEYKTSGNECLPCAAGTYSTMPNALSCDTHTVCDAGEYEQTDPTTSSDRRCAPCPTGTFYPSSGNTGLFCMQCSAGKYQNQTGQITCKACPEDTYQEYPARDHCIVRTEPVTCGEGEYVNIAYLYTHLNPCTVCAYGEFQDQLLHMQTACKECPQGTYADTQELSICKDCVPGKYQDQFGRSACKACGPDTYQNQPGQVSCKPLQYCGKGEYKTGEATATSDVSCEPCPAGEYISEDGHERTECDACPRGHYSNTPGTITCKPCAYGKYEDGIGHIACKSCPPGNYQDELGQLECKPCEDGTFQENSGRSMCNPLSSGCGQGELLDADATPTSDISCDLCPVGTYQPSTNHLQDKCLECQPGSFQDGIGQQECEACSPGYYQNEPAATRCKAAAPSCSFGEYVSQQPTSSTNRICADCPEGMYQSAAAHVESTCIACARGTVQGSTGQTACVDCEAGYFQDQRGQSTCKQCGAGTYSPDKAEGCTPCPSGTYQNTPGQSACKRCTPCQQGFSVVGGCDRDQTQDALCEDVTPPVISLQLGDGSYLEDDVFVVLANTTFAPFIATYTDTSGDPVLILEAPGPAEYDALRLDLVSSDQVLAFRARDTNGNIAVRMITIDVVENNFAQILVPTGSLVLAQAHPISRDVVLDGVRIIGPGGLDLTSFLDFSPNGIDTAVAGKYAVTYMMAGAPMDVGLAEPIVRPVIVRDINPPVITVDLVGNSITDGHLLLEGGVNFELPEPSAVDDVDGLVPVVTSFTPAPVSTLVPAGTLVTLFFDAQDSAGNMAEETIPIVVVDTLDPTVVLVGPSTLYHEFGTPYADAGAEATDVLDDALGVPLQVSLIFSDVDVQPERVPHSYSVVYQACDQAGNCASVQRTVTVLDTVPPVIALVGSTTLTVDAGTSFSSLPGATATDSSMRPVQIVVDRGGYSLNPAVLPTLFVITYTAYDVGNNTASVTRNVLVVDPTPSITLVGPSTVMLSLNQAYVELGATAEDSRDGDLTSSIVMTGVVGSSAGEYQLVYSVTDSDRNTASVSRTVVRLDLTTAEASVPTSTAPPGAGSQTMPQNQGSGNKGTSSGLFIGIAGGALVLVIALAVIVVVAYRRKYKHSRRHRTSRRGKGHRHGHRHSHKKSTEPMNGLVGANTTHMVSNPVYSLGRSTDSRSHESPPVLPPRGPQSAWDAPTFHEDNEVYSSNI